MNLPSALGLALLLAAAPTLISNASAQDVSSPPVMLDMGGIDTFVIHATPGGPPPQELADQITARLTPLLGVPSIPPSAVRIYAPDKDTATIFVFGRRIVTIDPAMATAENAKTPLELATRWANKLQVVLPQVNYRAPGQALPDTPDHPKVQVTKSMTQVGGDIGEVNIGHRVVIRLRGVQQSGQTAAERADAVRSRLFDALRAPRPTTTAQVAPSASADTTPAASPGNGLAASTPPAAAGVLTSDSAADSADITVVPVAPADAKTATSTTDAASSSAPDTSAPKGPVTLDVNGIGIVTVTPAEAKRAGLPSADALAESWAKNIRAALTVNSSSPTAATSPTQPSSPAPAPATPPAPSSPAPAPSTPPASSSPAPAPASPPAPSSPAPAPTAPPASSSPAPAPSAPPAPPSPAPAPSTPPATNSPAAAPAPAPSASPSAQPAQ